MECSISDCAGKVYGKGLCNKHWQRAYRAANKERKVEYERVYHLAHRELRAEQVKAARAADPEKFAERGRRYRAANKERIAEYNRQYAKANPETGRASVRRRRSRKVELLMNSYTTDQVCARTHGACHLCLAPLDDTVHIEHVIPIVRRGPDCLDCVAPSHRACNQSKGSKVGSASATILDAALASFEAFHGSPYSGPLHIVPEGWSR